MMSKWVEINDPVSGRDIKVHVNPEISEELYALDKGNPDAVSAFIEDKVMPATLNSIRNRASVDEVLEFANRIRNAGGASVFLDELIPSEPGESESCLIANALNFDCAVDTNDGEWAMTLYNPDTAQAIADDLGLEVKHQDANDEDYAISYIYLPEDIWRVAAAFDTYQDVELEKFNVENIDTREQMST